MPSQMLLPALSPGMEAVTLARWLKKEGDKFERGDVIAEIETDKATIEFEAENGGILGTILVPEGTQGVKVNQPIALILGEGEERNANVGIEPPESSKPGQAVTAPAFRPEPVDPAKPALTPTAASDKNENRRASASPLARRLAKDAGVDLSKLVGSGPGGRVVRLDVERAKANVDTGGAPPPATSASGYREAPLADA